MSVSKTAFIAFALFFFTCSSVCTRTVFITGGNRGIGLALVKEYLSAGDHVYTTYRSPESSTELLGINNTQLITIKVDLLNDDCEQIICDAIKDTALDIIIHNAGMFAYKANNAPTLDKKEWLDSFKLNAIVPVTLTLALKDNLRKGGIKKVIAISSRRASNALNIQDEYAGRYAYRSSKAALNSAMIALSGTLKEDRITTIMLHPGRVATQMTKFDGVDPLESACRIVSVIERVTFADSGSFIDVDTQQIIPW